MISKLFLRLLTLLVMFIINTALRTGQPTDLFQISTLEPLTPTTKILITSPGQNVSNDEGLSSMYIRMIPAVATVGVFVVGVLIICIYYCLKQNINHKKEAKPIEDAQLNNDWLAELRKTQKNKSSFLFGRRGSTFQSKLKMKKYALYDDMLEEHKRALKLQRLHTMRKTTTTISNMSQSSESNDESTGLRKVSSKLRIQEMAMRHKEHQSQLDFHLDLPSRERHLPRWGTTSSSISQDDTEHRFKTESEMATFRMFTEDTEQIDLSPTNISLQTSTDDDTEPLIVTRRPRHVMSKRRTAPPSSKNDSKQSSMDMGEKDSFAEEDDGVGDADDDDDDDDDDGIVMTVDEVTSTDQEGQSTNILDQPDIKVALRKLSNINEAPNRISRRPKSMNAVLSRGLINSKVDGNNQDKASQKRQSWYQGLFKSKKNTDSTASVDDLIENHVNKAIYSRFVDTEYDEDEPGTSSELRKRNLQVRQRPKTWFVPSENQRKKEANKVDTITELFANLMDLPKTKREGSWYDNNVQVSSKTNDTEGPSTSDMTEKEELMLLNEVERRLIENIDDDNILENEVLALESLLNDVAKFSSEYSEDYGSAEFRKQISFSEANESMSRSSRSNSPKKQDSFDIRAAKVMSVYDTQLLQEAKSSEPTTTL